MNIKFKVIKLRLYIIPAAVLALSIALTFPVLKAEKADANAVKTVYFTFNDGPSERTEEILDILAKEKIKASKTAMIPIPIMIFLILIKTTLEACGEEIISSF